MEEKAESIAPAAPAAARPASRELSPRSQEVTNSYQSSSSKLLTALATSPLAAGAATTSTKNLAVSTSTSPRASKDGVPSRLNDLSAPRSPRPKSASPSATQAAAAQPPWGLGAGGSSKATGGWGKAAAELLKDGALGASSKSKSSSWTKTTAALRQREREAKLRERQQAVAHAAEAAFAAQEAEKERQAAKREAARKAAAVQAGKALSEQETRHAKEEAKNQEKTRAKKEATVKLLARFKRAADLAGVNKHGESLDDHTPIAESVASAAAKLREIVLESRKANAVECERVAQKAYKVAARKAAALERSEVLLASWRAAEAAELEAASGETADQQAQRAAASRANAEKAVAAAAKAEAAFEAAEEAKANADDDEAEAEATAAVAGNGGGNENNKASSSSGGSADRGSADSAGAKPNPADSPIKRKQDAAASKVAAPKGGSISAKAAPSLLADARKDMPPLIPVPATTTTLIVRSLVPVRLCPRILSPGLSPSHPPLASGLLCLFLDLSPPQPPQPPQPPLLTLRPCQVMHALNHLLEEHSVEMDAARNAFGSWHKTSWLDPRSNTIKPKSIKGWTCEQ